ncbi:MAG TPA: LysM domain-containing protein, partial [Acidobacteriota bacterium]
MGNSVTGPGGPGIPLGPDNFFENSQTTVKEGENLKTLAERLYVTEKELRDANPGIKEPLKKDQKISYPKNYMNDRSDVDHSSHTTHSKKKSKDGFDKDDGRRFNVSDEG